MVPSARIARMAASAMGRKVKDGPDRLMRPEPMCKPPQRRDRRLICISDKRPLVMSAVDTM